LRGNGIDFSSKLNNELTWCWLVP